MGAWGELGKVGIQNLVEPPWVQLRVPQKAAPETAAAEGCGCPPSPSTRSWVSGDHSDPSPMGHQDHKTTFLLDVRPTHPGRTFSAVKWREAKVRATQEGGKVGGWGATSVLTSGVRI